MSAFLLAFGFGDPWMLAGLSLAGIPLLIHLLHRRRFIETQWAAMRFLIEATRKQSRRLRLEHLILLLLRTLLMILLVLAFARPSTESATGVLATSLPVHRILVLDATLSMQFQEEGSSDAGTEDVRQASGTRFARAVKLARELLQQGQRGDAWNLVRIADQEPFTIVAQPSFSADTVEAELQELAATDSGANLPAVLEAVVELTKQATDLPRKEVLFVTDLQVATWNQGAGQQSERVRRLLRQIAERAKLSVVNVSAVDAANAAVTGVGLDSPLVSAGKETRVTSTVRNFGSSPRKNQIVELLVNDRLIDTRRVDLPPGVDVSVDWTQTFQSSGDHKLEVRLQQDGLPLDDRRWLALPVRDDIRVLLVNGRPSGNRRESASFYVARALAPHAAGETSASGVHPQIISESELPGTNLAPFDVIVLCNVGLMTERESGLLEAFVRGGRGLVILPGDLTNADSYNTRLFRDGKGILPAKLGERVATPDRADPFEFDARGFEHPIVRVFQGNPGAGLEATLTFEFLRLTPTPDAGVALWFQGGAPALVERSVGAGRTVLSATSADDRWGTWSIWAPSFVPMMHEIIAFSLGSQWRQRQLTIGEPLVVTTSTRGTDGNVVITGPNGLTDEVGFEDRDGVPTAVSTQTRTAGVYTVEHAAGGRPEWYAVNINSDESDLTALTQEQFQSQVFDGLDVQLHTERDALATPMLSQVSSTMSGLIRTLAWIVLLALLIEPLMAWRFPLGVSALGVTALAVAVGALTGPVWGIVAAGVAMICLVVRERRLRLSYASD